VNLGLGLTSLALVLSYCLKLHYSRAAAADLLWILEPTRRLVELTTGSGFGFEPEGFVSTDLGIVITPACAGVNFMIMALLTLALGQLGRALSRHDRTHYYRHSASVS
jgi:exosortase K